MMGHSISFYGKKYGKLSLSYHCYLFLSEILYLYLSLYPVHDDYYFAWLYSAVGSTSYSRARDPGFNTWSHHILSFPLPLVVSYLQKYVHEVLVNPLGGLSLPRKSVDRLTYRPDMTIDAYRGCKTTTQFTVQIPGTA